MQQIWASSGPIWPPWPPSGRLLLLWASYNALKVHCWLLIVHKMLHICSVMINCKTPLLSVGIVIHIINITFPLENIQCSLWHNKDTNSDVTSSSIKRSVWRPDRRCRSSTNGQHENSHWSVQTKCSASSYSTVEVFDRQHEHAAANRSHRFAHIGGAV